MTKLFSPRRLYCCCCCGGGGAHYHVPHHGHGRHVWRKTVIFGVFVFSLYFALLSFVSFLAVSNHGVIGKPGGGSGGVPSIYISHQLIYKNGSFDTNFNHNLGGGGLLTFNGGGPRNGSSSRDLGLSIQKTVGSSTRINVHHGSQPRRDPAFASVASDIIRSQAIFKCVPVHFRQEPRATVALASFPGSGNTWLRYLLQLSTGIFTGSVYKDFALQRNGFPGESMTNGRVLVVKTHESGPMARAHFQKAILLIRKPAEAILAEFNRRAAGHIGHAGRDKYTRNAGRYWSSFVAQKGKSWTETNLDWIDGFHGHLLISMYHQLVGNTTQELTKILDFLGEPVTEPVMNCVISNKEGIYRRRKKNAQFNPFTPKMEKFLATQERVVYNAVQRRMRREAATTTTTVETLRLRLRPRPHPAPSGPPIANAKNNHNLESYLSATNRSSNSTKSKFKEIKEASKG